LRAVTDVSDSALGVSTASRIPNKPQARNARCDRPRPVAAPVSQEVLDFDPPPVVETLPQLDLPPARYPERMSDFSWKPDRHCADRAHERKIDIQQAVLSCQRPEKVAPGNRENIQLRTRNGITAVCDIVSGTILTTYWEGNDKRNRFRTEQHSHAV